jgi:hypothetical protein
MGDLERRIFKVLVGDQRRPANTDGSESVGALENLSHRLRCTLDE